MYILTWRWSPLLRRASLVWRRAPHRLEPPVKALLLLHAKTRGRHECPRDRIESTDGRWQDAMSGGPALVGCACAATAPHLNNAVGSGRCRVKIIARIGQVL